MNLKLSSFSETRAASEVLFLKHRYQYMLASSFLQDVEDSKGYKDDEAPDYANAARKFVNNRRNNSQGSRLGSVGSDGRRGRGVRPLMDPTGNPLASSKADRGQMHPDNVEFFRNLMSQAKAKGPVPPKDK